jgi:hypothetical protein
MMDPWVSYCESEAITRDTFNLRGRDGTRDRNFEHLLIAYLPTSQSTTPSPSQPCKTAPICNIICITIFNTKLISAQIIDYKKRVIKLMRYATQIDRKIPPPPAYLDIS